MKHNFRTMNRRQMHVTFINSDPKDEKPTVGGQRAERTNTYDIGWTRSNISVTSL